MSLKIHTRVKSLAAAVLSLLLCASQASAGLLVRGTDGLVMTGADGVHYENTSGLVMTGADSVLGMGVNGISWTPTTGLVMTGADGLVMTGADGFSYRAERADSVSINSVDGLVMTGADGLVMTGADGTTYRATSVRIREADGLVMTGADGLVMTGADGYQRTGADGLVMTGADGLVMTGADTVRLARAAEVTATAPDGSVYTVRASDGLVMTGADGLVMTGADTLRMTGVQGLVMTGADDILSAGAGVGAGLGLRSFDPELAAALDQATDDSGINAAVVYHHYPTDADIAELRRIGVTGGTRFRALPVVIVSATPDQIVAISDLPTVRSVYGNRTFKWSADTSRQTTGLTRVRTDADLTARNAGVALSGRNVRVAVIDTGIDGTHPDLAGRVARNVKLADLQGTPSPDFIYPQNVEGITNTDQAYGHGTFVAGVISGSGAKSTGSRFKGYAPGASLVGLAAGDANLFYVLAGFDYVLANASTLNIKVVNCSFSANTLFDLDDPVNVASKMLADAGVNVVFSAGNTGPGMNTLNPYAVAPWVVSVGATDVRGRLAKFSSRGDFASALFKPTLVAPGENVVSLRAAGVNVTGITGVPTDATANDISLTELPYYTTASGTSFSAPQVAGTIALMLEANPQLTPADVRSILRHTATPLAPYLEHEVGAGMLNAHAAVLEAAFPERHLSEFRSTLDRGQVTFSKSGEQTFEDTALPGRTEDTALSVPDGALFASVQVSWGPFYSVSDLALSLFDSQNTRRADSNLVNLPGLTGKRERVVVNRPEPGLWHARVAHSTGSVSVSQAYTGVFEYGLASYAPTDLGAYAGTPALEAVRQALRTYVLIPDGQLFRPDAAATRAEFAQALVQGARVPLYVAARPMFTDVTDPWVRSAVESAQKSPLGPLFRDVQAGGAFNPSGGLDRVTASVALVRAAGLEAEAKANDVMMLYQDFGQVPGQWQNYVIIAVKYGLIDDDGSGYFRPQQNLTRAQLARSMAAIARLQSE